MYVKLTTCPFCENKEELFVLLETDRLHFICKSCEKYFTEGVYNELPQQPKRSRETVEETC